jgi:nucleoside-diphosphate-sugar epimerase
MIAVTGASGLLGTAVVRRLAAQHKSVRAIKRHNSDMSFLDNLDGKIAYHDADILDTLSLNEAFKDVTHVVHVAGAVSFNPRHAERVMDINVRGTQNVVDTCLANGVKRLIHISSVAALGRQKGQTIITENNKWIDSPLHSTYAKAKYLAELEVYRGQEEGLSTVIINPSVILAEGNWNLSSAQLFKYVWEEKPFYFDGSLNYVDAEDVVSLIERLLDAGVEGQRFIASAGKTSFLEFFEKVALEFGKKQPTIRLGKNVLKIGAIVESLRSRITGAEPRLTRETVRLAGAQFRYENEKIRNCLNFEFQPIDKTLKRCCGYYMEKMNPKKLTETS